jgi:hypothetical protein
MQEHFKIYKGLQRPLVFKIFKGKYIYWAAGVLIAGVLGAGIVSSVVSSFAGIVTLIGITIPGLLYTVNKQKLGLYAKNRDEKVYIIRQKYTIRK